MKNTHTHLKIDLDINTCTIAAVKAPKVGLATHATHVLIIASTPNEEGPFAARPTATNPPTMECVAEIGKPYIVAMSVVTPAPAKTHNMPSANNNVPSHPSAAYA